MARVLGFDTETTGLDTSKDKIIEAAWCLWDTGLNKPLLMKSSILHHADLVIEPEAAKVHGITLEEMNEFGVEPHFFYNDMDTVIDIFKVDYLVAHNAINFDKPILLENLKLTGREYPNIQKANWIDTRQDLPFDEEPPSRSLNNLALDQGFLNPFKHRALFDVMTMLRVMSKYNFDEIVAHSKIPYIIIRALVEYEERQLAKDQRFSWENLGDKKYPKWWVKQIKENKYEDEVLRCKNFKIVKL